MKEEEGRAGGAGEAEGAREEETYYSLLATHHTPHPKP